MTSKTPLTEAELAQLAQVKVKDVKTAIAQASKLIKPFLKASG